MEEATQEDVFERTEDGIVNVSERQRRAASPLALRFVGGDRFIVGVPARDLSVAEVNEFGLDVEALADSGLYERPGRAPKREQAATADTTSE